MRYCPASVDQLFFVIFHSSTWSTTLIPHYDGDVHFDYNMNRKSISTNLNAGFDETRRITYTETATFEFAAEKKLDINTRLQFPYKVGKSCTRWSQPLNLKQIY